ncbi:MAG: hypothetical protein GC160_12700 [Acidobacteria bacterium]|nr:hypothetical protein [Acidobacteriota bacterium]
MALLFCLPAWADETSPGCSIDTIAGGGRSFSGDGGPAVHAEFDGLTDAVAGPDGSIYAADSGNGRVRRITPDGLVTTLAGPAAGLREPTRLAVSPEGVVYACDRGARRVWRIGADGTATSLFDARRAGLGLEVGPAAGADGALYLADPEHHRVWRLDAEGELTPFAGTGERADPSINAVGGPAIATPLNDPRDVAVGPDGSVYIAETGARRIRRVFADGTMGTHLDLGIIGIPGLSRTYASGLLGWLGESAGPSRPIRLAVGDGYTDVLLDPGDSVRGIGGVFPGVIFTPVPLRVAAAPTGPQQIVIDIGAVSLGPVIRRYSLSAPLTLQLGFDLPSPRSVGLLADGRVLFADEQDRLFAATIPTAENEAPELLAGLGFDGPGGDGGPGAEARLFEPREVVARRSGEIFIAEKERVRWIDRAGVIRSLPRDLSNAHLAIDPKDNVYISTADEILRMRSSGLLEQIAAFRPCAEDDTDCGDGGPLREASFKGFGPMAAGTDGTVYLLDRPATLPSLESSITIDLRLNVRTISPDGEVGSVIPDQRLFWNQVAIGPDASGGVLASNPIQSNLWRLNRNSSRAVSGSYGFVSSLDRGAPAGLVGDASGNVYFSRDETVRRLTPEGVLNTIAGQPDRSGYTGDGGPASAALLQAPAGLALTADGDLLIADPEANVVRGVVAPEACDHVIRPQIKLDGVEGARVASSFADFLLGLPNGGPTTAAPGSIVSIYGVRLGPTEPLAADLATSQQLPLELGGVTVTVDGRPAPLLFASDGQINAVLPAETSSEGRATVRVTVDGVESEAEGIAMAPSAPQLLAILNPDGSRNLYEQPGPPEGEITFLVTGLGVAGVVDPAAIGREARELSSEGVRVLFNGAERDVEAEVLSVRTVEGLPESVIGVRFSMPSLEEGEPAGYGVFGLSSGPSVPFTIYVERP